MPDGDISSADPRALLAYSETGFRIDAELEASGASLAGVLAEFAATCRDFPTAVDASVAEPLRKYARRTAEDDLWVRRVGEQFMLADSAPSSFAAPAVSLDLNVSVQDWSPNQRVEFALRRALTHLPDELRRQLEAMLTPETLAWVVGILAVWVIGQAFGYGEAVDIALGLLAVVTLGPEAIRVGQELGDFVVGVASAGSETDLDAAGEHLATVVSIVGVDGLMALLAHRTGVLARDGLAAEMPRTARPWTSAVTAEGPSFVLELDDGLPPLGDDVLQMSGENGYTRTGKSAHKEWSDRLREDGSYDQVNQPLTTTDGERITVPYRVDLETGVEADARVQRAFPDAVSFKDGRIVDLKPVGRAISKDRQEIIRFINAFKAREGRLPEVIEIQRYDQITHEVVSTELYRPADFLPTNQIPVAPPDEMLTP